MSQLEYCLGKNCGVTFAGLKVASLFRLKKDQAEGLDYYAACFAKKGFKFFVLRDDGDRLLLYVYHEKRLEKRLAEPAVSEFLAKRGYRFSGVDEAISQLQSAFGGAEFPHEIGVFLGYDLNDVVSFIDCPAQGAIFTGCWKVYHDAEEKAKLFARFDRCAHCICEKLREGVSLTRIFQVA